MSRKPQADTILDRQFWEWEAKIPEDDELLLEKRSALSVAVDSFYSEKTLERILNAKTETEIDRALINARRTA